MYQELINKLSPKPKFNLEWYKDADLYSDGDVEDQMIKMIAENPPEDYVQAIHDNYSWPAYYHLTQVRKNVLNWYPFKPDSNVLEIGCGLGAITGVLCDKCNSVTAVELSKRRATAALLRCRERENLEIIVGNLNDIQFEKKFDYITLIGVLEYQGRYTNTDNPYRDFLVKIKSLLKPEGTLLIAIENQYGLKYWCGAGEDHTGVPFDGMNQYILTNQGIRTFSKVALKNLVAESGFKHSYFYYPMPDYKLPTAIYSEQCLPDKENMQDVEYYYSHGRNTLVADEKKIYKDVIENQAFEFMANSFLVECSDKEELGEVTFARLCTDRQRQYQLGTRFKKNGDVEKFPLYQKEGMEHIKQTVANEQDLKAHGLEILGSRMEDGVLKVDYTEAPTLEELFVNACRMGDREQVYACMDVLCDDLVMSSEEVEPEKNLMFALGIGDRENPEKYGRIQKRGYIDMIFKNAFYIDGKLHWFDQEWMLENVPARYVLFRTLGTVYFSFPDINDIVPMDELIDAYDLRQCWEDFISLEKLYKGSILDSKHINEGSVIQGVDMNACVANIKKIMQI